ncbi:G-type lectin S-receptor-like serine/threonine-protein kinase [Vitis vinifera]|uniref:G-type lectin S-receptor-like serine/threonine-protein kinase n=1 Tax=Vitis vinifera TaxID=29760 RepID=A0A438BPQ9_VITVI|nr:G-type lectin S-receptor-like serine/threonine-protein kinase [Vitis vinifera]
MILLQQLQLSSPIWWSFELGFFSPGNSKNRYLGIWYKKASKKPVVWVANRESPLTDSSGVLKVTQPGILVLVNGTNGILWNSTSSRSAQDPKAQLLESGNLVMRNAMIGIQKNFLWQSFDYPCDTLLPGMKFGWNSSSRPGSLSGPYGLIKKNEWTLYSTAQRDQCDNYAICGVNGICKIDQSPNCECMKGFSQSSKAIGTWKTGQMDAHTELLVYESMNLKECASLCLRNCSCTAYANSDIRGGGSGCLLWFGDLIDIRDFTENGQEFYVRMAAADLGFESVVHLAYVPLVLSFDFVTYSFTSVSIIADVKNLRTNYHAHYFME